VTNTSLNFDGSLILTKSSMHVFIGNFMAFLLVAYVALLNIVAVLKCLFCK
jgi:hypothetical protein